MVSKFDAGPCVAVMLKLVASYYSVLSSFAEHLIDVNRYVSHSAHIRGWVGQLELNIFLYTH